MGKKVKPTLGMFRCDNHHWECYWINDGDSDTPDECPACDIVQDGERIAKELRAELKQARKDIKLLTYELREEKLKLKQTQLDAHHYLTTKKKVEDEVGRRSL